MRAVCAIILAATLGEYALSLVDMGYDIDSTQPQEALPRMPQVPPELGSCLTKGPRCMHWTEQGQRASSYPSRVTSSPRRS